MVRILGTLLMILLAMVGTCADAYIYRVDVLRRCDKRTGKYQYLFMMGDWHDAMKVDHASVKHREEIEALLDRAKKNPLQVGFIVEDAVSNCPVHKAGCKKNVKSEKGVLPGLHICCSQRGISVDNAEYRFLRMRACRPWLHTYLNNMVKEKPTAAQVKDTAERIKTKSGELARVNIGDIFNEYQSVLNVVHAGENVGFIGNPLIQHYTDVIKQRALGLRLEDNTHTTLNDYLTKASEDRKKNVMTVLADLLTFDSELVDLLILKGIVSRLNTPYLFVIAGGAHTARVTSLLSRYGYELLETVQGRTRSQFDLSQCVGACVINGTHCQQPEPVSLDVIKKYFGTTPPSCSK